MENLKEKLIENCKKNASETNIRLAGVLHDSITDGPGLRFVIFTQGCSHHCKGCHNPETWNFNAGEDWSAEEILHELDKNKLTKGVTFSGGDPIDQVEKLFYLANEIKNRNLEVACYTGYTFEQMLTDPIKKAFLELCDVLIDGPFVLEQRSLALKFKGSKNQRIINVKKSLEQNKVVLEEGERWA